jgi:hypothetical protein
MRIIRYHEAGHAIAVYHHGYLITGVTVNYEECKTYFHRPIFDGWVTIGPIALNPETGEGIEEFALYLCQRCRADGTREER